MAHPDPNAPGRPTRYLKQALLSPNDPRTIYCASDGNQTAIDNNSDDGARLFVSRDDGVTWAVMDPLGQIPPAGTQEPLMAIAVTPVAASSIWAWFGYEYYRSDDEGNTWTQLSNDLLMYLTPQPKVCYNIVISPHSADRHYFSRADYFSRSLDGGVSATQIVAPSEHIDCRAVRVINYNGNDLLFQANDGGAAVSYDQGTTWTNINGTGLGIRENYGIAVNELSGSLASGTQDNDVSVYEAAIWRQPNLARDGGLIASSKKFRDLFFAEKWCCLDNGTTDMIYALFKNGPNWQYSSSYSPLPPQHRSRLRPLCTTERDDLLLGVVNVFKSSTGLQSPYLSFQKISSFETHFGPLPSDWVVRALTSAPSDPDVIYVSLTGMTWGDASQEKFFYRTTTGGGLGATDWTNITATLPDPVIESLGINAIVVDPNDPNRIWLGCGGYDPWGGGAAPYNGSNRVVYSDNGGSSWEDYSYGLPALAVNDLVYQRGSDDALYAATDIGVFYRHEGMTQWECFNEGLPTMIVNDLDIDHCSRTLYAGSHGRGLWSVPLYDAPAKERVISSNTPWSGKQLLAGTLRIQTGATLTITGTVHCYESAKIIVEPGAKLLVDGGTLTSQCGGFWSGIEVHGTTTQHQYGAPTPDHQGLVVLANGAVIEHAREGVRLWEPGNWNSMGGVIQALGTNDEPVVFRNCRRAVEFVQYHNFMPGSNALDDPRRNLSYFKFCQFEVTSDYRGGNDFDTHVTLWDVDGITFKGCSFANHQSNLQYSSELGHGITSLDATYQLLSACINTQAIGTPCPTAEVVPSFFVGLDHGIHATNSQTTRRFEVDGATFTGNVCGVYTNGVVGAKITRNKFFMGTRNVELDGVEDLAMFPHHRGVYTYNSFGFAIDDNEATMGNNPITTAEAYVVGYSQDHNDLVWRNRALGVENAYVGEGICADPGNKSTIGLRFYCNQNDGNGTDMWNRRIDDPLLQPEWPLHTIRTIQGATYRPAGNTFDRDTDPPAESDLHYNGTDNVVNYFHHSPNTAYHPIDNDPVYFTTTEATSVPHQLCESKVVVLVEDQWGDDVKLGVLGGYLEDEKLAYGNTRYLYEQLLDGGNTDAVVQQIISTWPQDAWQLREDLLAASPFLSIEVLRRLVEEAILPEAMVAEICIANPEATQRDGFLAWMQEESGHPLPTYMAELIVASWEERTYRFTLEEDMATHHAEMTQAANAMVQILQGDTVGEPVDSLRAVWGRIRTPAARYAEVLLLLQQDNYVDATTMSEAIATEYVLRSAWQQAEQARMVDFVGFLGAIHGDGRNAAQLTTSEQLALEGIIADAHDRPASWAQNLLCFFYQRCRAPLSGADGATHRAMLSSEGSRQAPKPALLLRPNPATTWVAIDHHLSGAVKNASLVIRDITGRVVERLVVRSAEAQTIWDVRNVQQGTYTVELLNAGAPVAIEKLVLQQ